MLTPETPVDEGLGEGEAAGVGVGLGLPQPGLTVSCVAWVHAACAFPMVLPEMVSVAIGRVNANMAARDLSRVT
ncbi:hypothetical protein AB0945_06095 [Streptomyces sp. NPDC005474]|uniref:hypothetical protein n=1 Tax=Streptomyces sp. NPDC005474 TaxID=3154878 RepID=UPI0034558F80